MGIVALQQRLQNLCGTELVVTGGSPQTQVHMLSAELALTAGWTVQRRAQFALGRTIARRAIAGLGRVGSSILMDADGAPVWPNGVVGSITHKRQNCLVAVAFSTRFHGIGVDLEDDAVDAAEDVIIQSVCTFPSERAVSPGVNAACRSPGTLVLTCKEAIYKALFPTARVDIGWEDIEVVIRSPHRFVGHWHAQRSFTWCIEGVLVVEGGWLAALVTLSGNHFSGLARDLSNV